MEQFILIFLCLFIGWALRKFDLLDDSSPRVLIRILIYASFPALVVVQAPLLFSKVSHLSEVWIPASMAWILFIVAFCIFAPLGRVLGWSRKTIGALILTAGLANTSFVGFPLLEALMGSESIQTAIIVDQAGSFLVVSTLGMLCGASFSGAHVSAAYLLRRIVTFPPFITLVFTYILFLFNISLPEGVLGACQRLGGTLVPLALVSVGVQLSLDLSHIKTHGFQLLLGLSYKLVLAPILFMVFYFWGLGNATDPAKIAVLESAMAPMITGAIVAAEFDLDTDVANLMVGIGIPLSLLTIPILHHVLAYFG